MIDKPINFRPAGKDPEFQLVHEDDCAEAVVAILDRKLPGAFNIAADGPMRLSAIMKRLGARTVPLPMRALLALAAAAWRHRLTQLSEAPPEYVYFVAYPWLLSNARLKSEVGFRFRYTTAQTLEAFLASR